MTTKRFCPMCEHPTYDGIKHDCAAWNMERILDDHSKRLRNLEAVAHEPVNFSRLVVERAEAVASVLERDPHQFSTRPCATCRAVTSILGRPFGCVRRAEDVSTRVDKS